MINSFILPEAVFIDIFKAKLKIAELNKLRSSCYNENKKCEKINIILLGKFMRQ